MWYVESLVCVVCAYSLCGLVHSNVAAQINRGFHRHSILTLQMNTLHVDQWFSTFSLHWANCRFTDATAGHELPELANYHN